MSSWIKTLLISLIVCYQRSLSVMLGPRCRFYPSCSQYAILCLKKYSVIHALFKTALRICKCHPYHHGGVDLP